MSSGVVLCDASGATCRHVEVSPHACWAQVCLRQPAGKGQLSGLQAQTNPAQPAQISPAHAVSHLPTPAPVSLAHWQEPTQAELDPGMQALVVSAETVAGGEAINEGKGQVKREHRSCTAHTAPIPAEACVSLCVCLGVFDPSYCDAAQGINSLVASSKKTASNICMLRMCYVAVLCCAGRRARGFQPVHLVVVGLVGGNDASSKLSSTALRQADAGSKDTSTAAVAQ